jgi:hypothetical protein
VKDNFERFMLACRQLEDKYFREVLEDVRTSSNVQGRQWLSGLMKDVEKWTRAHDVGGWRYEFQFSNMAESFNKLLLGIRAMPVNAIVIFSFHKLNEFFVDRHEATLQLQRAGQRWSLNAQQHMDKAIERAYTHEVTCLDHQTGTYEVIQRGGTTSDGEVRESRRHVVVIQDFSCTCGAPRQYHFPCSHMVAACNHRNFAWQSLIPREFSVENLILTWSPRFVPFRDSGSSQLQDAPLTQDSPRRSTHPPNRYTPGTDALGKGKGKTKRGT